MEDKELENKLMLAFTNWRGGAFYLQFPNGNKLSTTFAVGSYSDNHDEMSYDSWRSLEKPVESNTVEIMILKCPDELRKEIHRKFASESDNSVIPYLRIKEWLEIVNLLAAEPAQLSNKSLLGV